MELNIILLILATHFIADFLLQSDWMALNKSHDNLALFSHVVVYSIVTMFLIDTVTENKQLLSGWIALNFVLHFAQDWVTSRLNAYLWIKEQRHWFFVSIGFDQLLHYVALFVSYKLIVC